MPWEFEKYTAIDVIAALAGLCAMVWCSRQLLVTSRRLREWEGERGAQFLAQADQARRVYQLLLSIAAADGRVDVDEHDAVAQPLTTQWPQHVVPNDLHLWSRQVEPLEDPVPLARSLGSVLDPRTRNLVADWCREIAGLRPVQDSDTLLARVAVALAPRSA